MRRLKNYFTGQACLLISLLLLSACSGLPDGLVQEVKFMPDKIKQHQTFIDQEKKAFDALKNHHDWDFIRVYLEKEQWETFFTNASKELSSAQQLYKGQILPMMDRDDPTESTKFTSLVRTFKEKLTTTRKHAEQAQHRMTFLIKARDSAEDMHKTAQAESASISLYEGNFLDKVNKAAKDYPHKKTDLDTRKQGATDISREGKESIDIVNGEYGKIASAEIDYAKFADESVKLTYTLGTMKTYSAENTERVDELYKSYTKVLTDQRVEYFVIVGRASWCETDWCGGGTTRMYPPIQVDESIFEYFDTFTGNNIATITASWGRSKFKTHITPQAWGALKLDKVWNWPSGDNYADYWVEKTYVNTYHRYTEIVNDKMTEGSWVKVNEDDFWKSFDNLGMAVLSKPYGYYESDALTDAQPVGMAMIAKPTVVNGVASGSNQYGEWRQNSSGNSFWAYYGMYRMFGSLVGPSRYGYNDWNGYNNHRRGSSYYGRNAEYGTWGASTYRNSRYKNSDYAKRNPSAARSASSGRSGNSSRSNPSIRGAGSSSRSRGPSSGGK